MKTLHAGVILLLLTGAVVDAQEDTLPEWRTYAGGPHRLFFNPAETTVTADNVHQLRVKWTFRTGAIVTASPSIARLRIPGEGRIPIVFLQSWDGLACSLPGQTLLRMHYSASCNIHPRKRWVLTPL